MSTILFATHNKHKAAEIENLLSGRYSVLSLDDVGLTADIPEDEPTLLGNAQAKARYAFQHAGVPCFADDTGLEVDALNGAPGVHTARFAGPECSSERNIDKLLTCLNGIEHRTARFRTVIVYIDSLGTQHVFEGVCHGQIATCRLGSQGFGYDPIFLPDEAHGLSFAQMTMTDKNLISHRGRAVRAFVDSLK